MPRVLRSVHSGLVRTVVPLSILALTAVACQEPTLDADSAAAQILTQLQAADGPEIASVECPDGVVVAAGATFTCTAAETGGRTWAIEVTQMDDAGSLDIRITTNPPS